MKIFALNPSKKSLNENLLDKLNQLGEVTHKHEIIPLLEVEGITDTSTDKILLISPLYVNWALDNDTLDKIPNLKCVVVTSTSFSWLDVAYLASKNIPVFNGGNYSTNAVAEGCILLAMLVARKMPLMIQNNWKIDYANHLGFELTGKKVGVVGLGSIGGRTAELASSLGMAVTYWSKNTRNEKYAYVELEQLFKESDVIFITLASNKETEKLITDEMLNSMKSSTIFISIAHKVYNHQLLNELVRSGKIFGFANEESEENSSNSQGNIWSGIPFVWYTQESLHRNANLITTNISAFLNGDTKNKVN